MTVEPIGLICLLAGLFILWSGPKAGFYLLCPAMLLGAAAAIKLPAIGGASVQPAHILLGFVAIAVFQRSELRQASVKTLAFPNAGFWFCLFVFYGCVSAFFLPRIFANLTYVYSLARYGDEVGIQVLPLAPRASNITQAAYLAGNFICFVAAAAFAQRGGASVIARSIVVAAILCLIFAAADVLTNATNTQELMAFIRNANYRMLYEGEIGGLKRIVGSFPEAGAYSYAALGLYGFTLALWLDHYPLRHLGVICSLLLFTLLLSTSSTAYVSLLAFSLLVLAVCLSRSSTGSATPRQISFVGLTFLVLPILLLAAMLLSDLWSALSNLFDAALVTKLESPSGVERMLWNEQALVAFLDTVGWGAGVGSVRASSFIVALAAAVGLPGVFLFGAFLSRLWRAPATQIPLKVPDAIVMRAAGMACFAQFIAAMVSAGGTDLGLYFSMMAGVASAPIALRKPVGTRFQPPASNSRPNFALHRGRYP
jgi:O-Antigen ligase